MTIVSPPAAAPALDIGLVDSEPDARAIADVLCHIWPRADNLPPVNPELVWALAHAGNYVALIRHGSVPSGAAIGFLGRDAEGEHLHSHIAGILPGQRGASVGFALKQHQRSWAIDRNLQRITWTFDPLVARNAYFNVTKLGASLTAYYVDFYGSLDDGINGGDQTDRCLVTWRLTEPCAVEAANGTPKHVSLEGLRAAGAAQVLTIDGDGEPRLRPAVADTRLVQLPPDIVGIRATDPALAARWRSALREVFVATLADGLTVTGVSREGWYVFTRADQA